MAATATATKCQKNPHKWRGKKYTIDEDGVKWTFFFDDKGAVTHIVSNIPTTTKYPPPLKEKHDNDPRVLWCYYYTVEGELEDLYAITDPVQYAREYTEGFQYGYCPICEDSYLNDCPLHRKTSS